MKRGGGLSPAGDDPNATSWKLDYLDMTCDVCHKRTATIHLQEAVNGEQKSLHLCNECATAHTLGDGAMKDFSLSDLLSGLAAMTGDIGGDDKQSLPELTCPECGMTTALLQQSGVLGCAACYRAFEPVLAELVPGLRAGLTHVGKAPGQPARPAPAAEPGKEAARFQIDLLHRELEEAVAAEHYERAAELRDEIHRLQVIAGVDR